jgi:hypothetical protein
MSCACQRRIAEARFAFRGKIAQNFPGEPSLRTPRPLFLGFALTLLLAACGPKATPTPAATLPPATNTPVPTPVSPLAILILPADAPDALSKQYQTAVYDLAQSSGYRFQVRNALTPQQAASEPGLKVVVAVPPDPGLAGLAAVAPGVQFLSVGIPGVQAGGSISTIGGSDSTSRDAPFLAGYIAAMVAQDYRTGMVAEKDAAETPGIELAYENGNGFYCGLCRPVAPPYYGYPLEVEMPADTTGNAAAAYGDYLVDHNAAVVYIAPNAAEESLINGLASRGVLLIGEESPPENAKSSWIATIQPDWLSAIKDAWPKLVAGKGGFSQPSPLALADVNPDLLSPGKQRLAEETLNGLADGQIGTSVQP